MTCSEIFLVNESSTFNVLSQVYIDGSLAQQADVSSILAYCYRTDTNAAVQEDVSLTVATVIQDTPVLNNMWTKDSTGYNFIHAVPASWCSEGAITYQLEYKFTTSGGSVFYVGPIMVRTEDLLSN